MNKDFLIIKQRLYCISKMAILEVKEGLHKVIKYAATPLITLGIFVVGLMFLIYKSPGLQLPSWSIIILLALLCLLIVVILIFLIFDPKRLQFTAEEQIGWRKMEMLADSLTQKPYMSGELPPEESGGLIEDKSGEKS